MGWRKKFSAAFQRVVERAGLSGSPKYLRRARATAECRLNGPAAAAKILGHADGTGALALKNYVDRSQLLENVALPPSLPAVALPNLGQSVRPQNEVGSRVNGSNGEHAVPLVPPTNGHTEADWLAWV